MTSAGKIEIAGETISQDARWKKWDAPYVVVAGTVSVYKSTSSASTLTIDPGVIVKFNSSFWLQIGSGANQGALVAHGTAVDRIAFTRSGTSGTWGGVSFQDGTVDATTVIEYSNIEYSSGLTISSASPVVRNTIISDLSGYVNLSSSNAVFENMTINSTVTNYALALNFSNPTLTNVSVSTYGAYGILPRSFS